MAEVVIIGGGGIGLTTALLLAKDGHRVTVLERDPAPPPPPGPTAWDDWERRGVNQFRLLHYILPGFRAVAATEVPELIDALVAAGALRQNLVTEAPDFVRGDVRPDDDRFELVTARRPVFESVLASVAAATDGLSIRRGTAVTGLLTEEPTEGVTHVTGVVTDDGTEHRGDIVIDAGGRRSAIAKLLGAVGASAPVDEAEDSGFVYFGRHFRSGDGSTPARLGPGLQHYESVSVLALPADNGTWGLGFVCSSKDAELRSLRHEDRWTAAMGAFPLLAHWLDGEPLDDDIIVMANIADRRRSFVADGRPVATGVLPVGDAWACTNPSVGRGLSIGAKHAVALRDLLQEADLADRRGTALAWHDATEATVGGWYRDTLSFDRHRLAEMSAQIEGRPYATDDPSWAIAQAMAVAAMKDHDVFRAVVSVGGVLDRAEDVLAQPGIFDKVLALGGDPEPAPGPSRTELVALANP